MSTKDTQNANLILDRLKKAYNMKYDAEIADYLGKNPSTISTWRRRDTLDYPLIFSKCNDVNANYIMHGDLPIKREGFLSKPEAIVEESRKEYKVKEIIEKIESLAIHPDVKMAFLKTYLKILEDQKQGW